MNKPIDAAARDTAADPISPAPSPRVPAALNRRGLLRGGVSSVLLGGLSLAACGGGEDVLAVVTPPPPPPPPAPPPAPSASAITEVSFASPVLGGTRYYKVYLPAGYETSGLRYPVIYLLHGRGDNLSAWGRNKALLDELIAGGKMPAAIAIMPDAPSSDRGGYWVDSAYTKDSAARREDRDRHHQRAAAACGRDLPHHPAPQCARAGRLFDGRLRRAALRAGLSRAVLRRHRDEPGGLHAAAAGGLQHARVRRLRHRQHLVRGRDLPRQELSRAAAGVCRQEPAAEDVHRRRRRRVQEPRPGRGRQ
jgi:hypothetical protein